MIKRGSVKGFLYRREAKNICMANISSCSQMYLWLDLCQSLTTISAAQLRKMKGRKGFQQTLVMGLSWAR